MITIQGKGKTVYGPIIPGVTSGLIHYWDAANKESYSNGSWYDSIGDLNGSLISGATHLGFYKDSGIVFDGNNARVTLNSTYTFGNGNWTVECTVIGNSQGANNILSNDSGGPVSNAFGTSSNKISYSSYDNINGWKGNYGNTTLDYTNWWNLTWVNNNNYMIMYVNGFADSSYFYSYTNNGGPVNSIGRNWYSTLLGKIGILKIYNRSLSSEEILKNFNCIKPRYDPFIIPMTLALEILFVDVGTIPVGYISDVYSVTEWNTKFDLPTNGTPFTSVQVIGNTVKLYGGENINVDTIVFTDSEILDNLLEISDYAGSIIIGGMWAFGNGDLASILRKIFLPNIISVAYSSLGGPYSSNTLTIYIPKCTSLGSSVLNNSVFQWMYYANPSLSLTLTIPTTLMTCNAGSPDGDITFLQANGAVTIIQV